MRPQNILITVIDAKVSSNFDIRMSSMTRLRTREALSTRASLSKRSNLMILTVVEALTPRIWRIGSLELTGNRPRIGSQTTSPSASTKTVIQKGKMEMRSTTKKPWQYLFAIIFRE